MTADARPSMTRLVCLPLPMRRAVTATSAAGRLRRLLGVRPTWGRFFEAVDEIVRHTRILWATGAARSCSST